MKKIGMIGGAGVAASNIINQLIEETLTKAGAYRDSHHPEIIIYQATQSPSRSMFLEEKGKSFIRDYIEIAKKLKSIGAEIICMNCNTAHFAIDDIQKEVDIPFINLIEKVVLEAQKTRKTNIGLVASDGCLQGRVYEKYIKKLIPNAVILYPDKTMQKEVTRGICNIKNAARFEDEKSKNRPRNIFANICKSLRDNGAEIIIIGCTDIRVDFKEENTLDSSEILVASIIKEIKWK